MTRDNYTLNNTEVTLGTQADFKNAGSNDFILNETKSKKSMADHLRSVGPKCEAKMKSMFRKKMVYKRIPILTWLPKYTVQDGIGDLVAGITVGLTVIPQALAYAGIAGLPPAYGLYGSFMGCFVYIFLGSCKDVPMGPTAIASLLTLQAAGGVWQRAVLACFLTGLIEIVMGIFGLGFIIDFVSGPVSSGFTSSAALIILTSQVKDIFGIKASGSTFIDTWISIGNDIHNARIGDTCLGFVCVVVLLFMRMLTSVTIGPRDDDMKRGWQVMVNKFLWLIGTARNAILVVVAGGIAAAFYNSGQDHFRLIGDIQPGLPSFQPPPFSIEGEFNSTTGEVIQAEQSFMDMVGYINSGLIVIPLIALLENIAICKAFANGKSVDATQELLAIGVSNVVNSFVMGYPGTGALSRGAVNNASGVRTPLGSLYTGILVILSLLFLTPLFFYIPKAALAAIIISAVIFMVEYKVIKPMWRSKKSDLIPGLATFIACLALPIEFGILIGIMINVLFILYQSARPNISMEENKTSCGQSYLMITPDRCLIFPSVDYVRNLINKSGMRSQVPVVIDCTHIYGADFSAAQIVECLLKDFRKRKQPLLFYNLKPSVSEVFEGIDDDYRVYYDYTSLESAISSKI